MIDRRQVDPGGQPDLEQPHLIAALYEDVGRIEIRMDHSELVSTTEAEQDLRHQHVGAPCIQASFGQEHRQPLAVQQFAGDIARPAIIRLRLEGRLADLINRRYVGMNPIVGAVQSMAKRSHGRSVRAYAARQYAKRYPPAADRIERRMAYAKPIPVQRLEQ